MSFIPSPSLSNLYRTFAGGTRQQSQPSAQQSQPPSSQQSQQQTTQSQKPQSETYYSQTSSPQLLQVQQPSKSKSPVSDTDKLKFKYGILTSSLFL